MFGLTKAFEEMGKAAARAVNELRELLDTYYIVSGRSDHDLPILFSNTLNHPAPKSRPWLSAHKRIGKGFRSQKVRSNRRKAKRKSQLIKRRCNA